MKTVTLVTGNQGKLKEWQRLFPAEFQLQAADVDLDEIQSLDLETIIKDKAERAYAAIGSPVIVEDIAAGLDKLHGLPGPFIKFFEVELGRDALFQLADAAGDPVTVTALVAYYDGQNFVLARGDVHGTVSSARGNNGFGFDVCFIPDGQTKTYAEMSPAQKDAVSHRGKAVAELVRQLHHLTLG